MTNHSLKRISQWLCALLTILVFGVADAYAGGTAYSRARAYLRSDAPSGSGKVYVGQAATSSPSYNTSSSSEKAGEKTTTTYHFYAQAATGYKFTGWYSKNANDEYVAASNSTVSGTTYKYTDTHYVVNVTSGSNPSSGTSYTDKDLYAGFIKIVQMSFIRPEDGSFTIMHNGAAVADYASFTVDGKVVLTATPDAGYKLRGWYTTTDGGVTKNYFAFAEEIEPSLTSNVTIGAEFVLDDGKADFWVKGTTTTYNDLNAANTAAAATSAKTIVLVNSGTLPAGTYTISSGVTLLIPYGSDYSKTDQPNIVHVTSIGSAPALSVYKKLSLAAGATINCSGKICVGGQMMSINGGNPTSVVRGRAGVLDLSRGGLINLNSGSVLYAWGFVQGQDIDQGNNTSGMGTIDAKSGSTVWEVFQCGEWRGGTASSTIYSNRSSWKFFPFQSYTVQNIEAPITYRYGATGKCKWTIFGDGKIYTVDFTLIGSSNALFNMSSGTLNKRYDATTDRICYELNGTNAVNALSLSAMGETINSSEYRLPIPANMQITVTGGTTSISNQMVLHAGAYVDIRSGATLNINTNVYIFDQTDWDTYCMYKYYYRSYKSLTKHYDRGEGTSKATLEDATVIVDGNLTFGGSGRLYSTTNGANIRGNNGGRITFGTLPTQTTIVMCKELKDNVSVSVSSANMHNIDGSYTKSVASTAFYNVNGRWFAAADKDPKADHTYKFTYIKSGAVYGTGGTNATINTLYRSGWIDVKADVCDNWWDGLNDTYLYNYTFNNAWHQYEQTPTVIGEGDEAATIYSGTDGKLYAKSECTWEEYSGADENCLQTIGGVKKAFVNGSFVALTKNTEDEAYHNTANATEYYICFKDICEWHAATKVAGANKAYTVTATSQKYIWYNGAWLAATQESPYFYTRSESGEKTYYEYVGSEWTEANVVAESTRNGAMTRYFNLPDAFTDANDNTKPGESTTIKIMKNVTITSALTYRPVDAKGGTCTIDLNGFTLSGSIDNMITINHDKAVLVVLDQSPEETGKISISYSANNTRRRAVYVQNGRLMLNSGTIQATNSQAQVDAIYVNTNELCDINGGQVKATATSGAYGVHTAGGTARCTIKGGTITATSPASKGVYSEGGEIRMSAGTVNATTTGTEAMGLATTNTATSLITLTGGTINATAASTAVGVQVGASGGTNGTATISGGTVSAKTTGATARALRSYATSTVNGGTFIATAATSDARGITVGSGVMRINAGVLVNDTANTQAYAVYTAGGKTWVNGGQFRSATKNTTAAYGFYANAGTDTINGGDFFVTSKTTDAYGIFVPSTTPSVRLNGGKFMVKTSNGSAAGAINNTAASTNLVLAAGYFNVAPAGSYVLAGKEVKDLDATVEASLISAGYTKKIAGTEYTVTFRTYNATASKWVVTTIKVESGKVPVYPDGTPIDYASVTSTGTFSHWRDITDPDNKVDYKDGLPAVGAADVTYQARYTTLYAQVTWGGNDSIFTNPKKAWNFAITKQQATIKILSNYGTEAAGGTMTQLLFNPTNANSIITFDLNGHSWVMGSNATASENKDVFLNVSPSKANCKLIVTDNSASGNGYLMNKQALTSNLMCAYVGAGELLLQGGALKVNNTSATNNAVGVQTSGTGVFNMTGGLVESKKEGDAVTGGTASGVYAYAATNISGGTIRVTNAKAQAIGVHMMRNTFTTYLSDDVHVITNGSQSYAVYGYGTVEVSGGTYDVTAEKVSPATWSTARGVYMNQNSSTYFGKATIKGDPVFNVTGVSGAAYGVYSHNHANVESVVESGTFNISTTNAGSAVGATAQDQATTTVKGGTFNVSIPNASYEGCWGVQTQAGGIVNVEGGTFTMTPAKVGGNNDCVRCTGDDNSQLNISGGTFISTNGAYCVRCFTGTTRISGNPVFSARNGIDLATWAVLSGDHTVTAIVDGGTFIATVGKAINSTTSTRTISDVASTVTGDLTIWDGKFYSASDQPVNSSCGTSYLKIRGGYYSTYTSSNVSNLNKYVVSPSTTEAYATTIDGRAYTYRVNTKYNVTWSVNGNTTVQEYNRNEMPSYGSTPTISDGNTYEFLGWNTAVDGSGDTIALVTTDVTYYAVFRKWEAEVIEGEATKGTKFESFRNAFAIAQNMPVAKIKILSNVYYSSSLTLNPDSVAGSKPLTIDLNNHIVNYTKTDATYALTINKAGCKLIIDDSSVAKGGQFGHRITATTATAIRAIYLQKGELELRNGTIIAQNNNNDGASGTGTRVVTGSAGTVFTMTGGKLYAKSRLDARAFNSDGAATFNATGGIIEATNEYTDSGTKWGSNAYGVVLWNNGTFNMSGTATMSIHSGAGALGVYPYGANAVANITGGSINCLAEVNTARCVQAINSGRANISGGDFTANGPDSGSNYNIETISVQGAPGGVVNVTGGTFHSDHGSPRAGVRVFGGTVNISGNPYFTTYNGICVGDWATAETISATAYVNGGTFVCPGYALYARESTNKYSGDLNGTVTGTMYVNGGYFKSTGSTICSTSSQAGRLILNGGYYSESAGTTQKTNITTYKGATTEVSTLSPVVHDAYSHDYHYQLLTDFDITWLGGDSYSKVTTLKSGTMPTNTELAGKCFIRNDSAFYFTGWNPTPSTVVGNVTYNAVGDYYEAEVKIGSGAWTRYTDFLEAWDVVQENANCSIRLLSNFTLADKILYKPTVANARTVFDLNNFTMTIGGTSTSGIDFNKADAVLTITDGSSAKGGKISMTRNTPSSTYTIYIYNGELKMAGGKIYVQNNQDKVNSSSWWPAIAVYVSTGTNAKLTMTGGTVESQAAYLAYTLYNYGTTNISGGTVRANATATGNSLGIYAVNGTATISGGTFNITASSTAVAATATGFINNTGSVCNNGTLNITGGTFNVSATNQSAWALSTNGAGKTISGTVYKAHGVINVSGGTFNVSCPAATATQVFAVQCNGWRLFDEATPHAMLAEELSEVNISGGTFTVDTRNNGAWLDNGGNVDLLRCWGSLNVSGGTFTIYQYKTPNAIQVYRGKATVSGNPVFNVYSHTSNARGITAAGWTHNDYCDKDATKNLAEAEINGGTFKIITEGQNTEGFLASGTTSDGGYAMNAKITVNGGTFLTICPNASGHYPIMLSSAADRAGTYGTATSEIYVNGGRFKSRKGTEADNTSSGAVNAHNATGKIWLTGGYYETNAQLSARVADTCLVTTLTSAEMDPEYNNGYRYRIDVDYQAKVTVGAVERKFALFRDAFDYAKTQNNATITLLRDIEYGGLNFIYNPSSVRSCTLDLNGFTFKGAVSGHTGDASYNNDRLLVINKAGATFTIKDSSVGKTGKWSHEKAGATFPVIVYHGKFVLESGTVHGKNTSGGSVQAIRSENYADALVSVIGGKAHAETSGAAYGMSTYNKATISGGEIIAESSAGEAFGVYTNAAEDTTVISGGRIYAAGTNGYGVRSASITTISGGKIIGECINTTGVAYGVSVAASTTTITGVDSIYAHATKNAYGVYSAGTGVATINGGKIVARNSDKDGATITAYAINSGTININNGTFYIYRDVAGSSNIQTTRTGNNATMNITGGTFHAEGYQAVNARGGTTTISGGTFYGATGICAMDWADAATITANVSVTDGTFDCTGVCLNVRSNNSNNSGRNGHAEVTISGGKFKTTGSTIAQLVQVDGTDPSTLTIAGGYFNEKSGTTHKDQIAGFVADTCEINTLDPLYEGIYKYEVAPHYVAKVQTGSTTKYHTTAKAAFDYAKTVANPTITLLDNCTLTEANYTINPGNWTGTLDLNNFTLTPTVDGSLGRAFTIGGTGTKFIVTDNSVGQGGQIYYKGNSSLPIIYFVMGTNAEMELAGGTLYVENTNASKKAIGFVVDGNPSQFTQSGGTFTIKGAYGANGYYGRGTATFTGGTMNVDGGAHQAIGLFPQESTSKLYVSGTFALNVTSSLADSYGVLVKNSGATGTISGGKFNFNQNTMVGAQLDGILTITGGYFVEHPSQAGRYKSQIAAFVPDTCDLNTLDPLYESKYKYQVVVHHVAKVVESGGAETYFALLTSALDYFKTKNNATLKMLDNAELPASPSRYTLIPTISNWRGTWDLNNKTVSCTYAPNQYAMFDLNKADAILTITDNSVSKRGRLEHVESSASGAVWGLNIENGEIILEAGTIYAKNPNADATGSKYGMSVKNANSRFTMNGGRIECVGSTNTQGLNLSGGSTATVSRGKILSIAELNGTVGNYAYGIYISGTSTLTVNGADSIYAKAGKADNTRAYALNAGGGTVTIEGTPFFIAESPSKGARALQSAGSASVKVNGGDFEAKAGTTDSYALIAEGTSTMTVNGGKYKTNQTNITYKSANATLTINGGYFNETSGTSHKTKIAGYVPDSCLITDITSADIDPEYANGYRYRIDVDYRVKVTHGAVEKKFLNLNDAFEYAKTVANPTITLIGNANFTGPYSLNPTVANWQGLLDLNNFTITSLQSASFADRYFTLNRSDIKLTVTDNSGAKGGVWNIVGAGVTQSYMIGIVVGLGELELAGGKIYVENNNAAQSVTAVNTWCSTINKAFYTQTGGTLEAKSSKSATAATIYGATTISGGEVKATTTSGATARAFTLGVHDGIIGALTISGNPTITVNTATSDAHAIYSSTNGATATVSGGTFNVTSGTTNAFGVYLQTNPSTITISDGTFNITTSGSGCRGMYLESGNGTINVSGGTFNVTTATSGSESWYNIEGMRITYGTGTINCTGGTFNITNHSKTTSAVGARTFAGTVNLSGAVEMNATQCFRISDTYISEVTAYVNISGGTFNSVSSVIYAKNTEGTDGNAGKFTSSDFTVTGGKFKTTGANHIDGVTPTSALHLQGGYFNERSGTNSRNNLATYVSAPYEVMNLDTDDAEYIAGYRYTVANAPVAKVKVGSSVTYHPTVASAFTKANTTTDASTITMLKDASVTSQLRLGNADGRNCTLDLNGHTITSTSSEQYPLIVRTSGGSLTITDLTESKLGRLDITTNYTGTAKDKNPFGVYLYAGTLNLNAGTISVSCSTDTVCGIVAKASQTFTMNGGALEVSATNMVGYGVNSSGTATIKNGTVQVAAKDRAYGIARSGGTFTVEDGKFNISSTSATAYATNKSSTDANLIIQGGWYTTNNRLATGVAAPYQVLSLAGQSPYLYEVAEAYTLTWNLDGGSESVAGTPAGLVKKGATVTAPTLTKTGYTFSAWSPAVVSPMPASDKTYTATWTRDTYTISYDLAGGSVASPNPTSYTVESSAITLNNPTKTNYVFAGWTGTGLAEPTTTVTIPAGSTGNRSYTATWTPAVASVTIGGGTPDYFATLQEALTFAQGKTDPTVTVLSDISGLTERLEHSGSTSCTLDLNGHTVAGTANALLYINYSSSSTKFIIKNTGGSENGKLSLVPSTAAHSYGVYVNKGTLQLEAGTIYLNYTQSSKTAYGVYIRNSRSFTMNGGKVHVVTTSRPTYGVLTYGTTKINGGAIQVEAGSGTGYGIDATNGNTTVKSPADIDVTGATAYGVRVGGYTPTATTSYNGTLNIEGGTFDVTASNGAAAGVIVYSGKDETDAYHDAGTAIISGGTFTVNASKAGKEACGVFVAAALADPEAIPAATITGGQFNVTAKTAANAYAVNTAAANTALLVQGGWYNISTNLDKYTAPTKSCNYRVLDLAGHSPYLFEVAEAYQLTWNLDGGTVTTAGTMVPVDATGTPNGFVAKGATLTAPVVTKTGYTFSAWTPAVAATMPAANTEYTATWNCVSPTSLTIASTDNKWDFCAGETMTLTVSGSNIAADATYQWQKWNGSSWDNISGATAASYSTAMTGAKGGQYCCAVTNPGGSCTTTSGGVWVRVWQLHLGDSDIDFTNTGTGMGSNTAVTLSSDTHYEFKLKDNNGGWFSLNNKTIVGTESDITLYGNNNDNVNLTSGLAGNYTFAINYSNKNNPTITITYPTANQPNNRNIYFDKSVIVDWGANIYYRIGHPTYNTNNTEEGGTAWTLVPGTDNFYTTKTMAFDGFEAWQIANNKSWSGSPNSIYKVDGTGYAITRATNFQKYVVGESGVTIVPTTFNNTESGCNYWNVAVTDGMLAHTATITTPTNGTITISNAAQSLSATATTAGIPHRTILTITATPAPGYALSTLTVNGIAFTSGNTFILAADATIAATFESAIVGDKLDIVDWTTSTLTINANGWKASGWPYTINDVEYQSSDRAADRTLTIPYSGAAGTDLWITVESGGEITNKNSYAIPFIGTTSGTNASSIVYVNSGTLTISSNITLATLVVRPEASVNIASGRTLTVGKLVLRTLPWQAASISGDFTTTETWYTRIAPNNRTITGPYEPITYEAARYYQFALPRNCSVPVKSVQISNGAKTTYGKAWLLKYYDEASRAASGAGDNWKVIEEDDYIQGGVGYEMSFNSAYYREFYFPLGEISSSDLGTTTAVSYHLGAAGVDHAGWNVVASPLMSVYDNTKANPETGLKVSWLMTDGSYDQGVPDYIYPAIPFSYQASKNGTISFESTALQALAPRRAVSAEDEPIRLQWLRVELKNADGIGDHTSVLSHPTRYEQTYKTGIDVAKQSFTASRALLYSSHAYGEMAFAGVADSILEAGVPLTIFSPSEQALTFSLRENDWLDRMAFVWLIDNETGLRYDLLEEDYTFTAKEGTTTGRFVLQGQFFAPEVPTGNRHVEGGNADSEKARKFIHEDKMYILINGRTYDSTGKLVNDK